MIKGKVKYVWDEPTKVRAFSAGAKVPVKKGDILEVEKARLNFFLDRGFIEIKDSQESFETKAEPKKETKKVKTKKTK